MIDVLFKIIVAVTLIIITFNIYSMYQVMETMYYRQEKHIELISESIDKIEVLIDKKD